MIEQDGNPSCSIDLFLGTGVEQCSIQGTRVDEFGNTIFNLIRFCTDKNSPTIVVINEFEYFLCS